MDGFTELAEATLQKMSGPSQRPFQIGWRFSAKALGPSMASSLEKTLDEILLSIA
jgi:hypothetical protein